MLRQSIKLIEHVSDGQPLKHQLRVAVALEKRLLSLPVLATYVDEGRLSQQVRTARERAILARRTCYEMSQAKDAGQVSWQQLSKGGVAAKKSSRFSLAISRTTTLAL